jgi:hypothetical protein
LHYVVYILEYGRVLYSCPLMMGRISCPQMSIRNYHYSLCNIPEERSSHLILLLDYPFNVILPPLYFITRQTHIFFLLFLIFSCDAKETCN